MVKLYTIAVPVLLCALSVNDYKDDPSEDSKEEFTIQAVITDSESGDPLPAANILIEGGYSGTISNSEGDIICSSSRSYPQRSR